MKVLIIEDEKLIADNLKEGLEKHRFSVDVAYDANGGHSLLNDYSYDIIFLDLIPFFFVW